MSELKHRLNWDKPCVVNPSHPLLPWINLCVIILVTIPIVVIGVALLIADSSIQGSLVVGAQKNLWFAVSFLLLLAIIVPISTWCAAQFGDKTFFFIGAIFFFIPIFFSAFTTNYWIMMVFRAFSALGAGAIFPTTLTIIERMFNPKQKSFAIAIYMASGFGIGISLGTFIGGYAAEFLSWPAIFLLSASSAPLVLLSTWLFFQEQERVSKKRFDFLGTLLYLILIGSLVTGLSNVKQPWITEGVHDPWMISCALLFLLSLCGFIWRELTVIDPLINIRLFKIRSFVLGNCSVFIVSLTLFSTIVHLSEIFENQLHYSKYHVGLLGIPFGLSIGVFGSISGLLAKVIGIRIPAILGMSLVAISCFTQHSITIQSDHAQYFLLQTLRGIGIGFSLGPFTALSLKDVLIEDVGQAAVTVTLFRQFGGALGSIIIGLIQSFRFPFHLLRFGEQMNVNSPALENHLWNANTFLAGQEASISIIDPYSPQEITKAASVKGLMQLREYAAAQAQILSINDAYFLIGWASFIVLIIVLFYMLRAKWRGRHHINKT